MTIDVSEANFESDVLARSAQGPVVVYLWSPRSDACVAVGEVVERMINATAG